MVGSSPTAVYCCYCEGVEPDPGASLGDPHLVTFDGLLYDFQAAGEFVLVTDGGDLMIQVRQQPWSHNASVNTAMSVRVGSHRVGIYARQSPVLRVDGEAWNQPCTALAVEESENSCEEQGHRSAMSCERSLGGGSIQQLGATYTVVWPGDERRLEVRIRRRHLDIRFTPSASDRELEGLLGDGDGDPGNDLRSRDGHVVGPATLTYSELYRQFGDSWRVRPEESLFDYLPGESTFTFTNRSFPGSVLRSRDVDPDRRSHAERVCREAGLADPSLLEACVVDVVLLGDDQAAAAFEGLRSPRLVSQLLAEPKVAPVAATGTLAGRLQAQSGAAASVDPDRSRWSTSGGCRLVKARHGFGWLVPVLLLVWARGRRRRSAPVAPGRIGGAGRSPVGQPVSRLLR